MILAFYARVKKASHTLYAVRHKLYKDIFYGFCVWLMADAASIRLMAVLF